MVTKLRSGEGNPDAAADTADKNNPYLSPSQATHKCWTPYTLLNMFFSELVVTMIFFLRTYAHNYDGHHISTILCMHFQTFYFINSSSFLKIIYPHNYDLYMYTYR